MGKVLGIGELLWDVFPTGKYLGGAPANFAFHCRQMGLDAYPVSRVGQDALGKELLEELRTKGLPTDFVQMDPKHPTGTVRVEMEGTGHRFIITGQVAWDFIHEEEAVLQAVRSADAVCFGSLCQRNEQSRLAIMAMVRACPGLVVFDINLRQQFYTRQVIEDSLELASVLKLNIEELMTLRTFLELPGTTPVEIVQGMLESYELDLVCVTRGAEGTLLVNSETSVDQPGRPVQVVDTVGCGDAFTAVLVHGLLCGKDLNVIARDANRVGEFVATQPGATPSWPRDLVVSTE